MKIISILCLMTFTIDSRKSWINSRNAPFKLLSRKRSKLAHKPWILKGILASIKFSGLIFLDIQKAFDTVDHNILIAKLEHYGIRGIAKNLFESYLQNRQQFVALDDESRLYTTNWGVPQGSTLGPLLFLIYINDLINCTSVTPRLFADDTCLCFSSPNPENLQEIINSDLKIVSDWITANKLRINAQKSSALIISPKSNDKAY